MYSDELAPGGVVPLRLLGRDLVLFRGEDGKASVLDAHCPHLGAHLGHGGKVEGGCLRCPFHGWRFTGSGACDDIPHGAMKPAKVKTRSWPLAEVNGMLMLYFDPKGAKPAFEVPVLPELRSDGWSAFERRRWTVRAHVQEPIENVVDPMHFHHLHGHREKPRSEVTVRGPVLRGRMDMGSEGLLEWQGIGLGFGVMRITGPASVLFIACGTPLDEERIELRFSFSIKKGERPGTGEGVIRSVCAQIEQDIPIWENKAFLAKPLLTKEETGIRVYRSWARQFHTA
jgi:phenylpropionate dioxygenase-like ring-hydroxylating dioxygenase large terminal subunit